MKRENTDRNNFFTFLVFVVASVCKSFQHMIQSDHICSVVACQRYVCPNVISMTMIHDYYSGMYNVNYSLSLPLSLPLSLSILTIQPVECQKKTFSF